MMSDAARRLGERLLAADKLTADQMRAAMKEAREEHAEECAAIALEREFARVKALAWRLNANMTLHGGRKQQAIDACRRLAEEILRKES